MSSNSDTLNLKTILLGLQCICIGLGSVVAIGLGLYYLAVQGQAPLRVAVTCISAGIVLFLLSNIQLVKSFKWWGIEAQMREIDHKVQEVKNLADKVAALATVTGEFTLGLLAREGLFGAEMPRVQKLSIAKDMSLQLESLGVARGKINKILEPWHDSVLTDLLRPAYSELRSSFATMWDKALTGDVNEYDRRLNESGSVAGLNRVAAVESVFNELKKNAAFKIEKPDDIERSFREARHYAEHLDFSDVSYWLAARK